MRTCLTVCACVRVCERAWICVCACVCVLVCLRVCVCICVWTLLCVCVLTLIRVTTKFSKYKNYRVSDNLTVKVADFGLSREIYEKDYYRVSSKSPLLPIKWMAPESLNNSIFTEKTDVVRLRGTFF